MLKIWTYAIPNNGQFSGGQMHSHKWQCWPEGTFNDQQMHQLHNDDAIQVKIEETEPEEVPETPDTTMPPNTMIMDGKLYKDGKPKIEEPPPPPPVPAAPFELEVVPELDDEPVLVGESISNDQIRAELEAEDSLDAPPVEFTAAVDDLLVHPGPDLEGDGPEPAEFDEAAFTAELVKLPGIASGTAKAIIKVGIQSIDELKKFQAKHLVEELGMTPTMAARIMKAVG